MPPENPGQMHHILLHSSVSREPAKSLYLAPFYVFGQYVMLTRDAHCK